MTNQSGTEKNEEENGKRGGRGGIVVKLEVGTSSRGYGDDIKGCGGEERICGRRNNRG